MQRLHERDLAALCLDLDFTHVCLPATAEHRTTVTFPRSGRQVTRELDAVLWPDREDHPELEAQRRLLGSAAYAGQYQQQPVPPGGLIFQRTWWRFYDALPDRLDRYAQSWDMAFKGEPENDYVVGLTAARRGADIYLIDRVKGHWDFPATCHQVVAFRQRYPKVTELLVEEAANGAAIVSALRNQLPGLIAVRPEGGKVARAQAVAPLVEAGNVYLPNPRPDGRLRPERAWGEDFLDQCTAFPKAAHDDDIDALTQLLVRWQYLPSFIRARRLDEGLPPWIPLYG